MLKVHDWFRWGRRAGLSRGEGYFQSCTLETGGENQDAIKIILLYRLKLSNYSILGYNSILHVNFQVPDST
jgi:hypothetical protein